MKQLTYEEFCQLEMAVMISLRGDWGVHRVVRNAEHGFQREVIRFYKHRGDIYGGFKEPKIFWFLDDDDNVYANHACLYEAYMKKVCGVEE